MRALLSAALLCAVAMPAAAGSLRVSPVMLQFVAPAGAAMLTLRNEHNEPVDVQARVFRWRQVNGKDELTPTTDVVVSPPITTLPAAGEQTVRVVRVDKQPVSEEEAFRVIVDELPNPARRRAGTVNILLRYSIPVFFSPAAPSAPRVAWTVERQNGALSVTAKNTGGKWMRVANLKLTDANGASLAAQSGLVGYVLGGATIRWSLKPGSTVGAVKLAADTEAGPLNVPLPAAR